jgi:hypothetical protein
MSNRRVTSGISFVEDFRGRRGYLRCRIHTSPVEALSWMIFESPATQFSLMISKNTWLFALSNACVNRSSSFVDGF